MSVWLTQKQPIAGERCDGVQSAIWTQEVIGWSKTGKLFHFLLKEHIQIKISWNMYTEAMTFSQSGLIYLLKIHQAKVTSTEPISPNITYQWGNWLVLSLGTGWPSWWSTLPVASVQVGSGGQAAEPVLNLWSPAEGLSLFHRLCCLSESKEKKIK